MMDILTLHYFIRKILRKNCGLIKQWRVKRESRDGTDRTIDFNGAMTIKIKVFRFPFVEVGIDTSLV